jgi:hypothetical protein
LEIYEIPENSSFNRTSDDVVSTVECGNIFMNKERCLLGMKWPWHI